ncbi:WD repeat-containing protein 35 [Hypsibius exemplaris]|uniref:WD repeat-containing protein 35 n=1 Tax=Hypsibius exemplaris TaxID=2072580 RepID=A0A9X6RPV0_HYPEX|nr:WD repeat-containing protein 35 [Hypsibius exemplaris]
MSLFGSANPTEPPTQATKVLRVKSLRETYHLMETSSRSRPNALWDTPSPPVLWNILADKALQKLQLDLAEVCYIHGENYRGTQFINRLRKQKSDKVRQAEVSAHFGDLYRAEQEFNEANRSDLAFDMRRISGDWFRLKEMADDDQNDMALKNAHEGLGRYYYDRQSWDEAVKNFDHARDYAALYKCHMISGDVGKLEELAEILPTGHPLLIEIGQLLGRYGHSKASAKALRRSDHPELAVKVCLANHDFPTATEIARSVDIEGFSPKTISALMNQAIKEQVASQDGTKSLWDASKLYYNAGSFLESAKCLFQLLALEVENKSVDYVRLKKISVLAASAVEENKNSLGNRVGAGDRRMVLDDEESTSAEHLFLDDPWHAAEAYNLMIVAQTFYVQADYGKALRAAGTLCLYMDVLDPVHIFSTIALAGTSLKRWDVVNEALMRLVNMDGTTPAVRDEMEHFADELFAKCSPNDVDRDAALPTPMCMKCKERISIWGVRCEGCDTKYPLCMATGSPVTEAEVWQCDFCHHHCAASAILKRHVCPLCHVPRRLILGLNKSLSSFSWAGIVLLLRQAGGDHVVDQDPCDEPSAAYEGRDSVHVAATDQWYLYRAPKPVERAVVPVLTKRFRRSWTTYAPHGIARVGSGCLLSFIRLFVTVQQFIEVAQCNWIDQLNVG